MSLGATGRKVGISNHRSKLTLTPLNIRRFPDIYNFLYLLPLVA